MAVTKDMRDLETIFSRIVRMADVPEHASRVRRHRVRFSERMDVDPKPSERLLLRQAAIAEQKAKAEREASEARQRTAIRKARRVKNIKETDINLLLTQLKMGDNIDEQKAKSDREASEARERTAIQKARRVKNVKESDVNLLMTQLKMGGKK
jgi:hypothetical protein